MVNKYTIPLIGVGLLLLVSASKQIGNLFGQVGTTVGSSLQMGLDNFVSALTFGAVNPNQNNMQSMASSMMMPSSGGMKPVLIGNVDTTGNAGGLIGAGKPFDVLGGLTDPNAKPFDLLGSIKNFVGLGEPSNSVPLDPRATAEGLSPNTVMDFINNLTGTIRGSSQDVTLTTDALNSIFKGAYDYLAKGSTNLSDFLNTYKLPSGESLGDVLKVTPDAFGMVQTSMSNLSKGDMLQTMGLNMDKKVDTSYGVIGTGGNPNSIGLGKGTILPAQNLTQVLQQNQGLTASQAADLLYRMMMPNDGFNFGSNTGAGYTDVMFSPAMGKNPPMVLSLENNPVLKAYEAYKAMYGIM